MTITLGKTPTLRAWLLGSVSEVAMVIAVAGPA